MLERMPFSLDIDDQWPRPCRRVSTDATALRSPATAPASSAAASAIESRLAINRLI